MQSFLNRRGRAPAARSGLPLLRLWLGVALLALLGSGLGTPARAQAPPLLQSARFWFDAGAKTTMTAADGAFDAALETAVSSASAGLSVGAHTLRVEMLGADGQWGPAVTSTVAVLGSVTRTVNLQSGEVQLDNAAAVAVVATDGTFNQAVEDVVKSGLTAGAVGNHTIRLRLKDAAGTFGPWFTSTYAVLGTVARGVQVLSGEVQVDNTAAVPVIALDGSFNEVVETVVKGGLTAGAAGNHTVKIRLKDAGGTFGPWFTSTYAVLGTVTRSVQVLSGEVQVDNTTAVAVIALDGSFNQVVEAVIKGGLAAGAVGSHTIRLRLKDAAGSFGPWFTSTYAVLGSVTRSVQVLSGEVQIDNTAAVAVIALDGSFNEAVETVVKGGLTAGAAGNHTVKLRLKDAAGNFGLWFTSAYSVLGSVTRAVSVQSARYWIDSGAKTPLAALDGSFDTALETALATAVGGLSAGPHALHVELQDAAGNWGPTFSATTAVLGSLAHPVSIQSGESWWDNGSHTPLVVLNNNMGSAVATASQGSASLAVGPHTLSLRFQGQDGQWGNTVKLAVKVNPCTPVAATPTASAAPATISLGQPTTLAITSPVAGLTYTWTGPGLSASTGTSVTATPTAVGPATYSVIATTAAGCPSPAATVSVTVNPSAPAPTISGFTPATGPVGTMVLLTGTNFTGATAVTIGGVTATFTVTSTTQITVTVPAGAVTGPITVTTPGGTASSSSSFTVIPPPAITSFSPASGAANVLVTLTGTNFTGATSVKFNGVAATTFTVVSATSVTAKVPTTATSGLLSVTSPNGTGTSATAFTVLPAITSFSPSTGAAVGATVTVTGTGLSGATGVTFNGVAAASFTVVSATSLTAIVPATATTGKIAVVTPAGSALSASSFKVLPKITAFTPTTGTPNGAATLVTITGTGLLGATAVKFGTGACPAGTFTVVNSTTITATVPALAITGKLTVTTAGGTATSTANFGVAPTISSFTPAAGSPGSAVFVTGLNFTSTTAVKFNGVACTSTYNSTTQLTVTVPAGATTGPLTATTAYGSHTSADIYTVTTGAAPTITSFSPTTFVVQGTVITITGTHFTGATAVRFNTVTTPDVTVLSDTQVQAAVPPGATTGLLYVFTPTGMAKSATNLAIIQPPTLTSFAPTSGSPGAYVLIAGTLLTDATSVKFNGVEAASYVVNSATQIAAVVPAGATTGKLSVTTVAGTATSTANFTVTTAPAPTITSFTPASAGVGMLVTLTGTNFTGATSVKFNTTACPAGTFTVVSPTHLTATVPSGATTGKLFVTGPGGMAQSPVNFTVVPTPKLTAITPATGGAPGSTVVLTGSNLTGATSVTFGGVSAPSYVVTSATSITVTVPAGALSGPIQVTTPGGTATTTTTFSVTAGPAPTITSFSPASGPVGSFVTVTGTGFTGTLSAKVNATAVSSFTVNSATSLTLTVPTGATSGKLTVVTPDGMVVSTGLFTVTAAPKVTSFTPASGPVGTLVTITGTTLTGSTGVSFGGVAATSFTVVSSTQVKATVPAGAVTGTIQVRNGNAVATSTASFTVTSVRSGPLAVAADGPAPTVRLELYPNPAHAWVEVWANDGRPQAATLELFDVTGRHLSTTQVPTTGPTRLPLTSVPAGIYFLRCGTLMQRLVVE